MGLLDVFKKNKANEADDSSKDAVVMPDTEHTPETVDILRLVSEKYKNCTLNDDSLFFDDHGLTLKAEIAQENSGNGNHSVQIIFIMTHELFEEEMIESCAVIGRDRTEAIKNAVESFCAGVLTFVFAALNCEGESEIAVEILGKRAVFREPCTRGTYSIGVKFTENTDFWGLLKDEIPYYIGRKRAYWIKLYAAWTGKELICEVRINGVVYPELTQKLMKKIGKPKQSEFYGAAKQFIVLIQKDETYVPCPYTKDDVFRLTFDALERMYTINSQQRYEEVISEIRSGCPDKSLGSELVDFIPEMYCQMILGLNDSDSVTAYEPESKNTITLRKSQIRSFAYIEEAIFRYISTNKPTREQNMAVLGASARFNVINQALEKGSKMENLVLTDLIYAVNTDYEVW